MRKRTVVVAGLLALAVVLSGFALVGNSAVSDQVTVLADQVSALDQSVHPESLFEPAKEQAVDIRKSPIDLPAPLTRSQAETVVLNLETVEVEGKLADGTTYTYWTFNQTVPGPFLRVRVGDTVELHLKNNERSANVHSIDLHAVNGPDGGAGETQVKPGESKSFSFKALNPGLYVYHCASPHVPTHIAMGMYGMILVEPGEGLKPVDREFYVMQGEVYAAGRQNQDGHQPFDGDLLYNERPNFVVFNGAFQALTGDYALQAEVGDRIRMFVGNGGPNLVSSFHVIGEIFDVAHREAAAEESHNVQTTVIPAGGAAWVEFTVDAPGLYKLVDHSISRAIDKGAVATLVVTGPENPAVFQGAGGQ